MSSRDAVMLMPASADGHGVAICVDAAAAARATARRYRCKEALPQEELQALCWRDGAGIAAAPAGRARRMRGAVADGVIEGDGSAACAPWRRARRRRERFECSRQRVWRAAV